MKTEILEKDSFYHIYNRGINGCSIFKNDENKSYFLKLLKKYLIGYTEIYAFCLMENHYHLILKIISEPKIVTQKFSNFFNAYVKAFNKQENRTGSLFEKHFKRIKINDESQLRNVIAYVNLNPTHHLGIDSFSYYFSSLQSILSEKEIHLNRIEVLDLFGGKENFKFQHNGISETLEIKYRLE